MEGVGDALDADDETGSGESVVTDAVGKAEKERDEAFESEWKGEVQKEGGNNDATEFEINTLRWAAGAIDELEAAATMAKLRFLG